MSMRCLFICILSLLLKTTLGFSEEKFKGPLHNSASAVLNEEDQLCRGLFKVVVLGCGGGPKENNVSGYLLAPKESNTYIALDAGTLLAGIFLASEKGSFQEISLPPDAKYSLEGTIFRD